MNPRFSFELKLEKIRNYSLTNQKTVVIFYIYQIM